MKLGIYSVAGVEHDPQMKVYAPTFWYFRILKCRLNSRISHKCKLFDDFLAQFVDYSNLISVVRNEILRTNYKLTLTQYNNNTCYIHDNLNTPINIISILAKINIIF